MKFSYDWLQSYFKKKLPEPEKLAELLSDHFANVEEVKKEGGDFVLDIEVRPNRAADCFCHWGVAREVATILALRMKNQESKIREDKKVKAKDLIKVVVARLAERKIGGLRPAVNQQHCRRLQLCHAGN
jgi:phenylalanyl-tRNA synthetase beta subunit